MAYPAIPAAEVPCPRKFPSISTAARSLFRRLPRGQPRARLAPGGRRGSAPTEVPSLHRPCEKPRESEVSRRFPPTLAPPFPRTRRGFFGDIPGRNFVRSRHSSRCSLKKPAGGDGKPVNRRDRQLACQRLIVNAHLIGIVDHEFLSPQRYWATYHIVGRLGAGPSVRSEPKSAIVYEVPVVRCRRDEHQGVGTCQEIPINGKR